MQTKVTGQRKEQLFHSIQVFDPMWPLSKKEMSILFTFPSKNFEINKSVEKNPNKTKANLPVPPT